MVIYSFIVFQMQVFFELLLTLPNITGRYVCHVMVRDHFYVSSLKVINTN